jgi:replicative DNA helicase
MDHGLFPMLKKRWAFYISLSYPLRDGIHALQRVEDYLSVERQGDIKQVLKDLYLYCEKDVGDISRVPFGFSSLDQLTGGFQESDPIVIGARPSVGKTAFALNIALQIAKQDFPSFFPWKWPKAAV